MLKKVLSSILFIFILFFSTSSILAQSKVFTPGDLAQFDGRDNHKAYFAFEGKVYDVTGSKLWKLGEHFGLQAGEDLTGMLENAPHGTEVFSSFPVVGSFIDSDGSVKKVNSDESNDADNIDSDETYEVAGSQTSVTKKWYEGRIRFFGLSILGWSGIVLGIFFVLTFATCFALPWAKIPLPWAGTKPGPDPLDSVPKHMGWSSVHKYFVWIAVILGMIHGIIGFLQMLGLYL